MEESYDTGSGAGVLMLFVAICILLAGFIVIPRLGMNIRTNDHAVERHGDDALRARQLLEQAGPGNKFDCPDGRIRIIVQVDARHWAMGVSDGMGIEEITSFINSDRTYLRKEAVRCGATDDDLRFLGLTGLRLGW